MNRTFTNIKKVLIGGGYFLLWDWMVLNLGWSLTLGCDLPLHIMPEDIIPWMTSMFIVTLIYLLTIRSQKFNLTLLPIIALWAIQFIYALIFQYHPYDNLMDGIGFFGTLACYLHICLNTKKEPTTEQKNGPLGHFFCYLICFFH